MAHLWFTAHTGNWALQPMRPSPSMVRLSPKGPSLHSCEGEAQSADVVFMQACPNAGAPAWLLLAGPAAHVRVNGAKLVLGIRSLRDRDEIGVSGQRLFFSTEQLARIEPFVGSAQPAFCPRCKQVLEGGDLAVMCPRCRAWHHQTEKFPCWAYESKCALCQEQPTALDAGYSWTPEEL